MPDTSNGHDKIVQHEVEIKNLKEYLKEQFALVFKGLGQVESIMRLVQAQEMIIHDLTNAIAAQTKDLDTHCNDKSHDRNYYLAWVVGLLATFITLVTVYEKLHG
jgi:hypothetical protein